MNIRVKCSECGKKGTVRLHDETYAILSKNWYYFGDVRDGEYWECKKCNKNYIAE